MTRRLFGALVFFAFGTTILLGGASGCDSSRQAARSRSESSGGAGLKSAGGTSTDEESATREASESSPGEAGELDLGLADTDFTGVYQGAAGIADFNEDGHQDVLIAGSETSTLYLGRGDGTFSTSDAVLDGCYRCELATADVDGDGHRDALIAGTLYLGNGDGTFDRAAPGLAARAGWSANAIADVDEDGHEDLLLAGNADSGNPVAELHLGRGDGTFAPADTSLTGVWRGSASSADLDDDGHVDLLLTGENADEDPTTLLYLGNGDATFERAGAGLIDVLDSDASIGDVDEDGHLDVLLTGTAFGDEPGLYLGNGDGSFERADVDLVEFSDSANAIGDVDGDGHLDLLVTGEVNDLVRADGEEVSRGPTTRLYLGHGDGTFERAGVRLTGVTEGTASIADVDGDGTSDLLLTGKNDHREEVAKLYLGGGAAGFAPGGEPYYIDRRLTRKDLQGLGLRTLSLLRNTLYAKEGYEFDADWLDEHFRSRSWYEATGFDSDDLTGRDRQNAMLIAEYQQDLTLANLLARRALHWGPHGAPKEDWQPPGPFVNAKRAREALLLDEAIEDRRANGADATTDIRKGFGADLTLGTPAHDFPGAVEPESEAVQSFEVRVDEPLPGEETPLARGEIIGGFTDDDGRLRQMYVSLPFDQSAVPLHKVPNAMNNAFALRLVEDFGEPARYGHLDWHDASSFEAMRWKGERRGAELHRETVPGGSVAKYLLLYRLDPHRVCGPDDGFADWFEDFESALASGDARKAVEYFHFPFRDRGYPPGIASPKMRAANTASFDSREEFVDKVPDEYPIEPAEGLEQSILRISPSASPGCQFPDGRIVDVPGAGHYVFQRVDGEWKAVEITF